MIWSKSKNLMPYLLIIIAGFAVFSTSLWFPPTYGDDLRYLTTTSQINNPLIYFFSDHIISNQDSGNNLYRPLVSISLWITYRLFEVWAFPNQLIGVIVHILTACILYKIILHIRKDKFFSVAISMVFLISPATFWTATQVSDRTINYIGLFFSLFLYHIFFKKKIHVFYILVLSILSILSKEAGLIIPLLTIALFLLRNNLIINSSLVKNRKLFVLSLFLVLAYIGLRLMIFGKNFASYSQNGYLFFGLIPYNHPLDMPFPYSYLAYGENILKNMVASFLPVFTGNGSVVIRTSEFVNFLPILLSTAILSAISFTRRFSKIQILALLIIALNALLHFALFRYRVLYLAQIGFCLFLASSPKRTKTFFKTAVCILIIYSAVWISWWLSTHLVHRYTIHKSYIENFLQLPPENSDPTIDKNIILKVINLYKI